MLVRNKMSLFPFLFTRSSFPPSSPPFHLPSAFFPSISLLLSSLPSPFSFLPFHLPSAFFLSSHISPIPFLVLLCLFNSPYPPPPSFLSLIFPPRLLPAKYSPPNRIQVAKSRRRCRVG